MFDGQKQKMLTFKVKNKNPSNPVFYQRILAREQLILKALYTMQDLPLLNYYKQPSLAKDDAVILLQPEFYLEMLVESFLPKRYLRAEKRAQYEVGTYQNKFFDVDDIALCGEYIYVLLPDTRLYVAPISEVSNHSHLASGLPVIAAGHIFFNEGYLVTASNNSGHYKPTLQEMKKGLVWFLENTNYSFIFEDHSRAEVVDGHLVLQYFSASDFVRDIATAFSKPELEKFIFCLDSIIRLDMSRSFNNNDSDFESDSDQSLNLNSDIDIKHSEDQSIDSSVDTDHDEDEYIDSNASVDHKYNSDSLEGYDEDDSLFNNKENICEHENQAENIIESLPACNANPSQMLIREFTGASKRSRFKLQKSQWRAS